MDRNRGAYLGASYDSYAQRTENSTTHMIKNAYWTTKQAVIKKLGRKEDEHIVASDSELDSKLELFRSVQKTTMDLIRIIERYQERLCALSQAENEMGRFLKNKSSKDKTQAGKMMAAVGKSLSFSAQQRLSLRAPLSRLQQEVETFRYRAIADTLVTIQRMEATRTEYRGSLLWMKDVSDELDPDTYKQLDKFRSVQAQVRKTKSKFDKLKLDSMQKVDLLAASRCNLFSQVLALYQNSLLQFWEKTSRTMVAVAESFKGYQYYEFAMLKDLADESKKLAAITGKAEEGSKANESLLSLNEETADDLDKKLEAIFMREFKDDPDADITAALASVKSAKKGGEAEGKSKKRLGSENSNIDELLGGVDLDPEETDEDRAFLADLLGGATAGMGHTDTHGGDDAFESEWQSVFGRPGAGGESGQIPWWTGPFSKQGAESDGSKFSDLLPSALLDRTAGEASAPLLASGQQPGKGVQATPGMGKPLVAASAQAPGKASAQAGKKGGKTDINAWLSLFADLDPLANPDAVGAKEGQLSEA